MSNPSKQKGTGWETYLLQPLRRLWGDQVNRSALSGTNDYGDFTGVPFLHEAKCTAKPLFQAWARICEIKAHKAWVVIWKGDLRVRSGNGPYVFMPQELYDLLVNYALDNRPYPRDRFEMIKDDAKNILGGR